jgi:hypothetical protein
MSAAFRMADRLAGGQLEATMRQLRESERRSFDFIARQLHADYGVEASVTTIGAWCRQLGIEAPQEEPA